MDAAARAHIGKRALGENLERAAALISAAFELRDAFADSER